MYKLDAIKIEEKSLIDGSNEKSNMYMINISFKELIEICSLGHISINREVQRVRAEKMVQFIKAKSAFYPPLIVAVNKKDLINYSSKEKRIVIKKEKIKNEIVVIDGQHRFMSIKLWLEEMTLEDIDNLERYQSVFLVDNISEYQQRKLFMDINNNAKKVNVGTKLRLEKSIANYFTLKILNDNEELLRRIKMDDDQLYVSKDQSTCKKYPYKFLMDLNKKMLDKISKDFNKNNITFEDIKGLDEKINSIWEKIIEIMISIYKDENDNEIEINIITNNVFYEEIGIILKDYINNFFYRESEEEENDFIDKAIEFLEKIRLNMLDIDKSYHQSDKSTMKNRRDSIKEIFDQLRGESNE